MEPPCQLLSDLRASFNEGNAGCDRFNWFLSLLTHLSNLFPFLTRPPFPLWLDDNTALRGCGAASVLGYRHCTDLMGVLYLSHTPQSNHKTIFKVNYIFQFTHGRAMTKIFSSSTKSNMPFHHFREQSPCFQYYHVIIASLSFLWSKGL